MNDTVSHFHLCPHDPGKMAEAAERCWNTGCTTIVCDPATGFPCATIIKHPEYDDSGKVVRWFAAMFQDEKHKLVEEQP